jgi:beta-galactosidase
MMKDYPVLDNFDLSWNFHEGEFERPPRRLTAKANAASYAADLALDEFRLIAPRASLTGSDASGDKQVSFNRLETLGPGWRNVDLPHDWRIHNTPSCTGREKLKHGYQLAYQGYWHPGIVYYRKLFECDLPAEHERIFLRFDGVVGLSEYWLNGFYIGPHLTGYSPVKFNITDLIRPADEGPNVVLVRSDTTEAEGWWFEGGGLYRHVWLERQHAITVSEHGVVIRCSGVTEERATVNCSVLLDADSGAIADQAIQVSLALMNPFGVRIARSAPLDLALEKAMEVEFQIDRPVLWNIGKGRLYTMVVDIRHGSEVCFRKDYRFGLREIEFKRYGVLINGVSHKIKGCNIHSDSFGVGVAMPDRIIEGKLELLREMGTNTIRVAHHPPSIELVEHADRMGMLIIPENRLLSTAPQQLDYLRTMVKQFRNHPSILLWSLENEEISLQGTSVGTAILRRLVKVVRSLDPTRETSVGGVVKLEHAYHNTTSVVGMHYQGLLNTVKKSVSLFPNKSHIQDEVGLHAPTRGVYVTQKDRGHNSAFSTIGELFPALKALGSMPGVGSGDFSAKDNIATLLTEVFRESNTVGGCLWTGMDYHGEPVPTAWPSVISPYGARDIIGIPKDYYWLVRCLFRPEPLVHGFPHWTWPGKEGQQIPFRVYSNCEEVEVLVNGKAMARVAVDDCAAYFPDGIAYQSAECVVRGYINGRLAAEHYQWTAGSPERLVLQSDRTQLAADGVDVATVRVAVVDNGGNLCPSANDTIKFSIEGANGRIIGVGNGDNATTEPEQGNQRTAFNGWAAVLIQAPPATGILTLSATAKGLEMARQTFICTAVVRPHAVYEAWNELDGPAGRHSRPASHPGRL